MRFFLLFTLIIWQLAWPCHAAPAVEVTPHTFPLHFVSWFKSGPIVPQIAMKANFVAYPGVPTYQQFLDAPQNSPERTIARYIQVLTQSGPSLTPQALQAAKECYAQDERKESEEVVTRQIQNNSLQVLNATRGLYNPETPKGSDEIVRSNIKMWHRYDVGQLSIITLAVILPKRVQPFTTVYLRKSESSYFITTYGSGNRSEERKAPLHWIIALNESNMVTRPNLGQGFQATYGYRLPLRSALPGDSSGNLVAPPLEILFNGKVSDVLIDEKTVAADATQAFVKHAIQTFRQGTLPEFLALWTEYDNIHVFQPELQTQTGTKAGQIPPYDLQRNWDQVQVPLVFTIYCGVESLVFLRTSDSKELEFMVVWKQGPDNYKLSDSYQLTSGENTFPANLDYLFNSVEFQTYLNAQIDQFIEKTDAKQVAAPTAAQ